MKFDRGLLQRRRPKADEDRSPSRLSRIRTSTPVLIVVFFALWWTYGTYRPHPQPEPTRSNTQPSQVVPPGFVPDPAYTWVPRTRVEQQPIRQTPTTTTTTPPTTTTTTNPGFPQLPCLLPPPFCPATTTPSPSPSGPDPANPSTAQPGPGPTTTPGPGPVPTSTPPAR